MGIESNNHLSIGMLVTEITIFPDDSAELFGVWYYKERILPETKKQKELIHIDLAIGRCRKLKLVGSTRQAEDILRSCEWDPSHAETLFRDIGGLIKQAKKHRSIPFGVEELEEPMGTAIPVNMSVRLKRNVESVIAELNLGNGGIILEIAPDWNMDEEIRNFLKGRDN